MVRWIASQNASVFLETTRCNAEEYRSFLFYQPQAVIRCDRLEQVETSLMDLEQAVRDGFYVAGYLSYEAGYIFEPSLPPPSASSRPLLWFGVYDRPLIYNHYRHTFEGAGLSHDLLDDILSCDALEFSEDLSLSHNLDERSYRQSVAAIREQIAAGNTYQVNFTFKTAFPWPRSAAELYCRLRLNQRVGYAACITHDDLAILSFSPELFFRIQNGIVTMRPMKGTARRGRTLAEDEQAWRWLLHSDKNRAENLMIVDLIRNDIGKVAEIGSVKVPAFFEIERYDTLLQATSTVQANLRPRTSIADLLRSLYPSGSVTGAPKLRTMQIIRALEPEPRGVYTGAIGFISPGSEAVFNVAIRTVVLDRHVGQAEMGIGSGITFDSNASQEFRECLLKARFLVETTPTFKLFETLKWNLKSGWLFADEHRQRLAASAHYFDFSFDEWRWRETLDKVTLELENNSKDGWKARANFRVRITLSRTGEMSFTHDEVKRLPDQLWAGIASERMNSRNRFLYHKTTNRSNYDRALEVAQANGWFDIIFLNERGEVTEGARSNIIIRKGDRYFTPPVNCGLLAGIYRAHLLQEQRVPLAEKLLTVEDLFTADEILLCNSVRGLVPVALQPANSNRVAS